MLTNCLSILPVLRGVAILILSAWVISANAETWSQLTPLQRQALAPLASEWDALPTNRQKHYLLLAKNIRR